MDAQIEKIQKEAINEALQGELLNSKKNLNSEQIKELEHRIWQNWVKVGGGLIGNLGGIINKLLKK